MFKSSRAHGLAVLLAGGVLASSLNAAPQYASMNLRGDFNSWGNQAMSLVEGEIWQTEADFAAGGRYKFDVNGNWVTNFGDSTPDGTAGQSENNIVVGQAGHFRIFFSDKSKRYSAVRVTTLSKYNQVYLRGTFNNWGATAMTLTSDYVWEAEIQFSGTPGDRFKFDIMGDWALNFGDNDSVSGTQFSGNSEKGGKDIPIPEAGTYKVKFIDAQNLYQFTKVNQSGVGNVKFIVKDTVLQNGQLAYVPASDGMGVYLDGAYLGGGTIAGNLDAQGTATLNGLNAGGHTVVFGKMLSSHSVFNSDPFSFDVTANQTKDVNITINSARTIIHAAANVGMGNALYLTGQTALAGNWGTAFKMTWINNCGGGITGGCWEYRGPLPYGLQYKVVKAAWVSGNTISTNGVVWESGANHTVTNTAGYMANDIWPMF